MSESKDKQIILDGPYSQADFGDPKWIEHTKRELGIEEPSEFSARARKKKRIYKRKKSDPKPSA
jgi:hypothetical protein